MTKNPAISCKTPTDSIDFHIAQPGTMKTSNTQVEPASFKSILKREAKVPTLKKRKKRVRMTMPKSFSGETYKPLSRNERMQKKGKGSPRVNISSNFLESKTKTVKSGSNTQSKSLAEESASIKSVAEIKETEKTFLLSKGNISSPVVECSECSIEVKSPDVASPEGTPLRKILCQNCVSTLRKRTGKDMGSIEKTFMSFRKDQSMKFMGKGQSSTTSYKVSDDLYKSVLKRRSARLLSQVSTIVETSETSQTKKSNSIEEKKSETQINDASTRILDKPTATCGSFIVDAEIRESESAKSIKAAPPTKKKSSSRKRKKTTETAVCHKGKTIDASVNDQAGDAKKVNSETSEAVKNQQLEQEHSPRQCGNVEGTNNMKINVGTKGRGRKPARKTKITFPKAKKVRSKGQTKAPERVASQKEKTTEIVADQGVTENRKRYPTRSRNKQTVFEKDKVENKLGTNGTFVTDIASDKQTSGDAVFSRSTKTEESVETEDQNIKKNKSKAPRRKRAPQRKRRKGQEATDIENPEIKSSDGGNHETFTKLRKRGRKSRPQISEKEKEEKQRLEKNVGAAEIADNTAVNEQQESKDKGGMKKSVLHILDVEATEEPQDKGNMIFKNQDVLPIIKKAGSQSSSSVSDVSSVFHNTGNFNNTRLIFSWLILKMKFAVAFCYSFFPFKCYTILSKMILFQNEPSRLVKII